jgi:hypothetical protein
MGEAPDRSCHPRFATSPGKKNGGKTALTPSSHPAIGARVPSEPNMALSSLNGFLASALMGRA